MLAKAGTRLDLFTMLVPIEPGVPNAMHATGTLVPIDTFPGINQVFFLSNCADF